MFLLRFKDLKPFGKKMCSSAHLNIIFLMKITRHFIKQKKEPQVYSPLLLHSLFSWPVSVCLRSPPFQLYNEQKKLASGRFLEQICATWFRYCQRILCSLSLLE